MPETTIAQIRRLVGDDKGTQEFTDDYIAGVLDTNGGDSTEAADSQQGPICLTAADLRTAIESRSGDNFGPAFAQETARLRELGKPVMFEAL